MSYNLEPYPILQLISADPGYRLKTRDLQLIFKDWEGVQGGFRIKWVDDVNALVVFNDPSIGTSTPPPLDCPGIPFQEASLISR